MMTVKKRMSNEVIRAEHGGERIDVYLSSLLDDVSRSAVQGYIEKEYILVNSKKIAKNYKIKVGDEITVSVPPPHETEILPQDIPLEIVYEDDYLLVVNKPKGMVVHPAAGNEDGTLVNALLFHCKGRLSGINGVIRPGIVHRIDKDTSGLLIVAKNDFAHISLSEQIRAHSFTREYEAIATGRFRETEGTLDYPIGRSAADRKKMCVTEKNSRHAVTHYSVVTQYEKFAYLRLRLETGRTHQIRVHLAYIGHPILGDGVYGKSVPGLCGQCLNAKKIGFVHPKTNEYLEFETPTPDYFLSLMRGASHD